VGKVSIGATMAVLDFGGGPSPYLPQSSRTAGCSEKVLRLKICRDVWGTWSVHGLSPLPVAHLPSLSASFDYARRECAAAPATIELVIDGFYAVVHQEDGWPRPLVAFEADHPRPVSRRAGARGHHRDTGSVGRSRPSWLIEWRDAAMRLIIALAPRFMAMKRSKLDHMPI
jgi:hypothetical protein